MNMLIVRGVQTRQTPTPFGLPVMKTLLSLCDFFFFKLGLKNRFGYVTLQIKGINTSTAAFAFTCRSIKSLKFSPTVQSVSPVIHPKCLYLLIALRLLILEVLGTVFFLYDVKIYNRQTYQFVVLKKVVPPYFQYLVLFVSMRWHLP